MVLRVLPPNPRIKRKGFVWHDSAGPYAIAASIAVINSLRFAIKKGALGSAL